MKESNNRQISSPTKNRRKSRRRRMEIHRKSDLCSSNVLTSNVFVACYKWKQTSAGKEREREREKEALTRLHKIPCTNSIFTLFSTYLFLWVVSSAGQENSVITVPVKQKGEKEWVSETNVHANMFWTFVLCQLPSPLAWCLLFLPHILLVFTFLFLFLFFFSFVSICYFFCCFCF